MKTRTKKITSLLLILLGLSPLLLVFTFHLQREEIRSRMRERLESTRELHTITVAADKVIWVEDHEIWHNDMMFDIVSKKLENGNYIFTGLYDEEETELVKAKEESQRKNKEEQKLLVRYFHWVSNTFREKNFDPLVSATIKSDHVLFDEVFADQLYSKVPTPPPRSPLCIV